MKGKIVFSTVVSLVPVSNMSPSLVAQCGIFCHMSKNVCTSMTWGAARGPRRGWGCWPAASTPRTGRAWPPAPGCAGCDAASPQSACKHTWMRLLGQFKWITLTGRIRILGYCGKYLWYFFLVCHSQIKVHQTYLNQWQYCTSYRMIYFLYEVKCCFLSILLPKYLILCFFTSYSREINIWK